MEAKLMYLPPHFAESRPELLRQLMLAYPLAVLVTLGRDGLVANHIPLEYDPEPAPGGTLRGHVARANPVWNDFSAEVGALAVFQGPQRYISPSWYPTKAETGKVVPTYNYLVVHASGPLRIVEDPIWLRQLVERLTSQFESRRSDPWHVSDAPDDFIAGQLRAIVGIEIPVAKLVGKWKVSQNRTRTDREGVVQELRASGDDADAVIAHWVEESLDR
jgi:transcriptional regulator